MKTGYDNNGMFFRMAVKWVDRRPGNEEYIQNVNVIVFKGNPRDAAIAKATFWARIFNRKLYRNYNCVTAWYRPKPNKFHPTIYL